MKFTLRLAALFACLLLFAGAPSASAQAPGQTLTGRVTDVRDGDTIELRTSTGKAITVRLWGVDAPESSQRYGAAALLAL